MKIVHFLLVVFCAITMINSANASDDDDLLLLVPSIVGASTSGDEPPSELPGLIRVKQLVGTWFAPESPGSELGEFYRFDEATAEQSSDPAIFTILGDSSLFMDFFSEWCDGGMVGSYSSDTNGYLILCNWGFPDFDLGSIFFFPTVTNTFSFEEFFYVPSTSMLSTGTVFRTGVARRIADSKSQTSQAINGTSSEDVIAKREANLVEANELQMTEIKSLGTAALNRRSLETANLQKHLSALRAVNQ